MDAEKYAVLIDQLRRQVVRVSAARAAAQTVSDPPEPGVLITRQEVLAAGGFPDQPDECSSTLHKRWQLGCMTFFSAWREEVLKGTGRFPKTVRGEGFLLLSPEATVSEVVVDAYATASRVLSTADYIISHVRHTDLDPDAAKAKSDELMRLGRMRLAVTGEHRRAADRFSIDISDNPALIPLRQED